MRFSGTSLLGKQGQICFAEYLKQTKRGFLHEIWRLWPLEIGGVGDKHPHDSDHTECVSCTCK